ncbi:MAG TPA: endonuclease domain-containing protein [Gallionellaceae bacterium]|nr:endonuclease domain-containing protein [Gallionellaceae bacterium]
MQSYDKKLKPFSRALRSNITEAEQHLWHRLRNKQLCGVQFYRQKPLLSFIVDSYCPKADLVIELDGGQHHEPENRARDMERDKKLSRLGLHVLRFDDRQVLSETDAVMQVIHQHVQMRAA